jgi:hypothetical protein
VRLTCLKCGHQFELAPAGGSAGVRLNCVCGQDYTYPQVVNTGISPNERAAERSRARAFRAAGLVKNIGGFALGLSLLGILFFPLGLAGASIAVYVLTMLRGPVGRYSGRQAAMAALGLGVTVFIGEGAFAVSWYNAKRLAELRSIQQSAHEDLRALLRAQRLYHAGADTYGTFKEFRFAPQYGNYTFYLAPDDFVSANRDGHAVIDPLPPEASPGVAEGSFTAIAVGNLDNDEDVDIWKLDETGRIEHVKSDLPEEE